MIPLRYFWWHYFLNNFSLLDRWLRLVCLLMEYSYCIIIINHQNAVKFSDDTCSSTTVFHIASHGTPINIFFWTTFFSFYRLFYLSTRFLCFDSWISCHLIAKLVSEFLAVLLLFSSCASSDAVNADYHE